MSEAIEHGDIDAAPTVWRVVLLHWGMRVTHYFAVESEAEDFIGEVERLGGTIILRQALAAAIAQGEGKE